MTHREDPDYKLIEILRLQFLGRALENEALMRYVSNPDNIHEIGAALGGAIAKLQDLQASGRCPMFWHHVPDCRCVPDDWLVPTPRQEPLLEGLVRDVERLSERVEALYRRLEHPPRGR